MLKTSDFQPRILSIPPKIIGHTVLDWAQIFTSQESSIGVSQGQETGYWPEVGR